jgi:hypothetical protein
MGAKGRWECRPLHPADAWHVWGNVFWKRCYGYVFNFLSRFVMKHRYALNTTGGASGGGYIYWPFDRILNNCYTLPSRFIMWILVQAF